MPLLTQTEIAAELRVTTRTIREWSRGRKPKIPVVRVGRTVRYHLPSVLAVGANLKP